MAIRNINTINNSVGVIKNDKKLKIELVQHQFNHYRDAIIARNKDIVDAIDTYNYCIEKGLSKQVADFSAHRGIRKIGISNGNLTFTFNNWRAENSGPYTWVVETDGGEVYIKVDNNKSDVPTMVENARYYEDKDYVITPIFETYGGKTTYTCHDSERPLSALRDFASALPTFLDNFFDTIANLDKIN